MNKRIITISIDDDIYLTIEKLRGSLPRSLFINKFFKEKMNFQTADKLWNKIRRG